MSKTSAKNKVEVKSKFDAEFRRFSLERDSQARFDEFKGLIERLHRLKDIAFLISYIDPSDQDLLPINNDDNLRRALFNAKSLLRVIIQRKGDSLEELNGYGTIKPRNLISTILLGGHTPGRTKGLAISNPHDFRQVSSIIDVDIVPETCRRVRLLKHGSDKPLGFYIRDGTSVRVTQSGLEKIPGIFISRLVPGGLAESTGLLAVNDEVLEVNGIEVAGKTLDQVTDMMVANSSNLIVTVKPANQRTIAPVRRGSFSRNSHYSQLSSGSQQSHTTTGGSDADDKYDQDEIVDLTSAISTTTAGGGGGGGGGGVIPEEGDNLSTCSGGSLLMTSLLGPGGLSFTSSSTAAGAITNTTTTILNLNDTTTPTTSSTTAATTTISSSSNNSNNDDGILHL